MGVPKRLTEMQKRFAEYLVFGGPEGPVNKAEAAELAGYSKKRCRQEGAELTNPRQSPLVVSYVDQLKQERNLKFGVNYEGHVAELARIKELALKKNSFSAAVNAEKIRSALGGLTIDRRENINTMDQLSRDEIVARLADLQKKYPQAFTIEGDFEDVTNEQRSRVELLEHDKAELTQEVLRNED